MRLKTIIICVFVGAISFASPAQKIIVDTASTNKYIIKREAPAETTETPQKDDLSFGDRAVSIGKGILNRLKARLNLEEASESLKAKKEKYLGRKEEEEKQASGKSGN